MKIYIIERSNPYNYPEPEVLLNGANALQTVKQEYEDQLKELGMTQEMIKHGNGTYGCYWTFEDKSFTGDASIESDYDADRWQWRITEHEVQMA